MRFVIWGAGQTGRLVAEIVGHLEGLECVGFVDRDPSVHGRRFFGVPVLGGEERLESMLGEIDGALPVFGDPTARLRAFRRVEALGLEVVSVVAPNVSLASDVKLGKGIFISYSTTVLTGCEIGDYGFIGTGVNILHDTTIGPNCVLGGGSTIGASVTVGRNVSFGVGVSVASMGRIRIGDDARVAAGSVVLKDVPANAFVLGNPARVIAPNPPVEE